MSLLLKYLLWNERFLPKGRMFSDQLALEARAIEYDNYLKCRKQVSDRIEVLQNTVLLK